MLLRPALPTAGLLLALASACADPPPQARTVEGECTDVFGGQVCTWATIDATDQVTAFGVTVPLATIEGAPADMEMTWPPAAQASLALPEAARLATGMDHLAVNWEAHGHPPGPYLTPHFDFHFYSIPEGERTAIDCTEVVKPTLLPAGYALEDVEAPGLGLLVGSCVPQMGMHSLPVSGSSREGAFDGDIVIGYYRGGPIFIEPMIAQAKLRTRESFELAVPNVEGLPAGVRYPSAFSATYDAATDSYRFALSAP